MLYVFNFKDHSFVTTDFIEQAAEIGKKMIESGALDEDEVEIAFVDDDQRYTVDEFRQAWC